MSETAAALTQDHILGGKVSLRQAAKGYRAGVDAALLAAACDAGDGERVLDAGCGVGAVMLAGGGAAAGRAVRRRRARRRRPLALAQGEHR